MNTKPTTTPPKSRAPLTLLVLVILGIIVIAVAYKHKKTTEVYPVTQSSKAEQKAITPTDDEMTKLDKMAIENSEPEPTPAELAANGGPTTIPAEEGAAEPATPEAATPTTTPTQPTAPVAP